ncbi:aldehyde dehydrogenase family protein [Streptomyces fulvoviolaceus]|uniref:aldehyde dehydrogenase family protein n=1 Tax=Streptomyces fulvoviolaceus TaxID=285535 RepID=UPI000B1B0924|nr:aldehyde dehydrogenase family protein [Streptomyces fulvoviolaceus]
MSLFHEDRLLIDGELVPAGRSFETLDPSTGKVLGTASDAQAEHVEAAVAAARRAFDATDWMRDRDLRLRCLRQLYDALLEHREELRELTIAEVGAPRSLTHGSQLDEPIELVKWYADLLERYEFREELPVLESRGRRHRRWVEKEAAGVVAAILPYNFPNQLALAKLAPSLAAGCTVVLKGAADTPWTTLALGRIIAEHTDIPAGVVGVLTSSGPETGQLLTTHPDVDMVTFTGSTPVGRAIMAAASGTLKRVFLELGGKSAMVVLDDADLAQAAMFAAFTVCTHAGQGCGITSRLLVPRERHDEIVGLVTAMLGRVSYGDPADPATHMGPLISERQRAKVHGLVERAVAAGARLVTGGRPADREGFFYEPTLLCDVDPGSEIAQEEVFGPVLAVIPYDDEDDAVRIANDSVYGLSGAVLGADDERAIAVARRIRSGTFSINGGMFFGPDAPFGGFKQSGIGREMGVAGLEEFLELKTFGVAEK